MFELKNISLEILILFIFRLAPGKIIIVGGMKGGELYSNAATLKTVEVVDILDPDNVCQDLTPLLVPFKRKIRLG